MLLALLVEGGCDRQSRMAKRKKAHALQPSTTTNKKKRGGDEQKVDKPERSTLESEPVGNGDWQKADRVSRAKRKRVGREIDRTQDAGQAVAVVEAPIDQVSASSTVATFVGAKPSRDDAGWPALDEWLRKGGSTLDALEVRNDIATCGLGVFARRAIAAGEVVFTVPAKLMLTMKVAPKDSIVARVAELASNWKEEITPQFLMCLRLCRARSCSDDPFHVYAESLPDAAPGAASWPAVFRDFLSTTSLGPALAAADAELDQWERVLKRVADAEPALLKPDSAFHRTRLEWARGMLQSRQFPGSFSGSTGNQSFCMVPLLDLLNHKDTADVTVRVRAGMLEFICDDAVPAGQQVWNNYGSKANDELLMSYGFAVSGNSLDSVSLALASADGTSEGRSELRLTTMGVPQELIDSIEAEQNTGQFVALLRTVLLRKRAAAESLAQLPKALNFNVCKGPDAKARKRSIEAFLEGQLKVLEASLECMQTAQDEEQGKDEEEVAEEMEEGEEEEEVQLRRKKRRRGRR